MSQIVTQFPPNIDRFSTVARWYDAYRPQPPLVLLDLLTHMIQSAQPGLVVDLGCGTGLSSRVWMARAEQIIGIDANANMLAEAQAAVPSHNVRYQMGFSSQTGLPDACADIVTCVQCEQWMEPKSTIDEVFRILRPGGVFAIVDDYDLPLLQWEAVAAYQTFIRRMVRLIMKEKEEIVRRHVGLRWSKADYLTYLHDSNHFRFIKQSLLHSLEQGNAERLSGLALSQSNTRILLDRGLSEEEIGLTELRKAALRILGDQESLWYFSFQVILAVK